VAGRVVLKRREKLSSEGKLKGRSWPVYQVVGGSGDQRLREKVRPKKIKVAERLKR